MDSKIETYLQRRVRELRTEGFDDDQIVERLWATVDSKKKIREVIKKVSQ